MLSISVLGVGAGLLLAATGAIEVSAQDDAVIYLIELALIVTLFSDGLLVERELLRVHWSPPVRALLLAMPLTMVLLALCAKGLFAELSWAEALLLGGGALADRSGRHLGRGQDARGARVRSATRSTSSPA